MQSIYVELFKTLIFIVTTVFFHNLFFKHNKSIKISSLKHIGPQNKTNNINYYEQFFFYHKMKLVTRKI
jgi:hypothetical protein